MCRMLAIVPRGNVDSALLWSLRNLATSGLVKPGSSLGHRDGWGIVFWQDGVPTYLVRRPQDASTDEIFEKVCAQVDELKISSPLIAHLRKASVGAKTVENTHPFISGNWAFAHNGTIRRLRLRNSTDSEWFFKELIRLLSADAGNVKEAIATQVNEVKTAYPYTSLTFLLSNGKEVYAYRDFSGKDGEYYTMYYTQTPSGLVISQEQFFDSDWRELGNGDLLTSDSSRNFRISSLRAMEFAA
jgi:predicted glutamine amidotransferase